LKTLEKINRKAIRNSLEKEKDFSAQLAQLGVARPHARAPASPDRWTPPASDRPRPRTHARSLSLSPFRCSVGQACRHRFPSRSCPFSLTARGPTRQVLIPNLSPTPPPWTRPCLRIPATSTRPRPFRAHTLLAHFPLLICTLNRALSPSLSPCACNQVAPPPLTDVWSL
jgi:hypothetical protein